MFQNGIPQNTKCAERDGFHRAGHNYNVDILQNEIVGVNNTLLLMELMVCQVK